MAKGSVANKSKEKSVKTNTGQVVVISPQQKWDTDLRLWTSGLLLAVALLLYGNTLCNDYALDDGLMFTNNKLVTSGISGIGGILSHDSFYGGIGSAYSMNGGRWRPLSLISFAIEDQFFGMKPWIGHLINVLLYALTAILLMNFFKKFVFKKNIWIPFFIALLFVIHPIHTEVVANIKSRDEIFSLLFLILTLYYCLKWKMENGLPSLFKALLCYVLALLSKENGLTFVLIIPVTLYFFSQSEIKNQKSEILSSTLPFIAIAVFYIFIRIGLIGFSTAPVSELLDNPFLLATTGEKFATIFYALFYYLRLLIFPHPLLFDYSFNQIPYRHFTDASVIVSLLIHIGLAVYVLKNWKRKDKLVWCILFYLASIFIVSNIAVSVGATLAERFLYQPSIGFCVAVVILIKGALDKIAGENLQLKTKLAVALSVLVFIPAAAKTISRNIDWKNDFTLFTHDQKLSPNNARAATYAGIRYTTEGDSVTDPNKKREYWGKALELFYHAYDIYPNSASNYFNWGVVYSRMDSLERAEWAWSEGRKIKPNSTLLQQYDKFMSEKFYRMGLEKGLNKDSKDLKQSIILLNKAVKYDPSNAEYWYNLGGAYFTNAQADSALFCFENTLSIDPNHANALRGLQALKNK
jgi:tetratricopeptide (TPR) repeat protein